ncbi:NAD-dependent epimerase/dehydratase family protein [Bacteroidales bacterium]
MILITGATGLVGSHLMVELSNIGRPIRAIKRKHSDMSLVEKVFWLYANDPQTQLAGIQWMEGDLTDIAALDELLDGVEQVFHCAAVVSFHPSQIHQMMLTNVKGTANLVNALLHKGNIPLCHVSSIAALGRSETQEEITEGHLWKNSDNNSMYSVSKYAGEREVWRGIAEGLKAMMVNPSVILGPGNWKSGSSELFTLVSKGLKFYTNGSTGYVDVRDVAKSMMLVMEKQLFGERFIVSAGNLTYRQLFSQIALCLGKKPPTVNVSPWMAETAWRVMTVKGFITRSRPAITRETARTSLASKSYSSEKLIKATGIEFIPIEKSITDICRIFIADHRPA